MKHILEITERGTSLRVLDGTLTVQPPEQPEFSVPPDDLGSVLLTTSAMSITGAALATLATADVPVVVCDARQFPCGMFIPFAGKSDQTRVLAGQIAAPVPVRKRLWQLLVRAKLEGQAAVLSETGHSEAQSLAALAADVRSGDVGNAEATGARLYWRALGIFKTRARGAADANVLLDYTYTVLTSLCARAICAAGLHPGLGLRHRGGRNPFCLACDLVEPFRAAADLAVLRWLRDHQDDSALRPDAKRFLVRETLSERFHVDGREESPARAAEHAAVALREALLSGDASRFEAPRLAWENEERLQCG